MAHTSSSLYAFTEDEDAEEASEAHIEWSNLIFLPFHPVFKLMVLFSVIVKSNLGPIQSVYPIVYCWDVMDRVAYLSYIKYFYWYCCDTIYGIDTFLHVVHRQVTDKAMRREYLPKSAFLLLLDVISLIPFYRFVVGDMCPPVLLWPNILAFTEFLVIYRIVEYFSLVNTHSFWKMVVGFTLLLGCSINCISSFWLLLTKHGLCNNCEKGIYDWRNFVMHKLNETDEGYTTYIYSTVFVFSFAINRIIDDTKPSTIIEFNVVSLLVILGHLMVIFVIFPKLFAEAILRLRKLCTYYPQVKRLIAETKRRNTSPNASIEVEDFFCMMWKKRSGINRLPEIMTDLPRYLRVDLKYDLVWPVFYHSPILRKTSNPLKRMLCELIIPEYKLPGEKLFSGMNSHAHLYYLKSGVIQILSADDGITPILSVSGGTIFGDTSFQTPPLKRKIIVRCLTYCEVLYLTRVDYIRCIHKYPDDRRYILGMVKDRIKHARTLYTCKQHVRGLDRTEDEGIAWVKRRWWEISDTIDNWKRKSGKKESQKFKLPPEEAVYHCAKYIGQLVLCTDIQLQTKSLFARATFPWILLPDSSFGIVWNRVVICTVFLVLILYPPNVSTLQPLPAWFTFFVFWTDCIYAADICVNILTKLSRREDRTTSSAAVMFARCKTFNFILDVLATIWIEKIVVVLGKPQYHDVVQLNRVLKIYKLFSKDTIAWDVKENPTLKVCYKIFLLQFSWVYLLGYAIYVVVRFTPEMSTNYFFGKYSCDDVTPCEPGSNHVLGIATAWAMELMYPEFLPLKLVDVYYAMAVDYIYYLLFAYCKIQFVAVMYLKFREIVNFQYFVSKLKKYYKYCKIHKDLLHRLDRYLVCHWKYYKGMDIMHPNLLREEPYDIFWKVQGEVAEKIIGESQAFIGADPLLIRELAYASKFLILPKNATLFLFGVQSKNVSWVVQGNIRCEFHNEEGELLKVYYGPGYMLSVSSVFLNKASLRTYTACTECEILYIKVQDFFKIIKRYPDEWSYFENCIDKFSPVFEEIFQNYLRKHRDYQKKLRERIFHSRVSSLASIGKTQFQSVNPHAGLASDVWEDPESDFMRVWLFFRAMVAIVSITCASLQGGSGVTIRWSLIMIGAFCDCIACIDIFIKVCLAYYDGRGMLVSDKIQCVLHYLSRGFLFDIIGALPWFEFLRIIMRDYIDDDAAILTNTICKFAHLYIILGYIDYIGDTPTMNVAFIVILKWQVVTVLIMLGASHYFIYNCVDYTFDGRSSLVHMERKNGCWLPKFLEINQEPTIEQLHILYAESLNLAQSGLVKMNFGRFHIDREKLGVGISLCILGFYYWFVMCYSLTLLVLNSRGNTLFQHGVSQLSKFLHGERVEQSLINQALAHFTYWWMRTKGINIHHLTNERIGVVLRQDLNYFFFQKTFTALDTLLQGGEHLSRQLASSSTQIYVLPNQEIIRENDITNHVYVVHRGRVNISQDGEKIATLTKGCIFGQLLGSVSRPVRISAASEDYADLLQINLRQFQDLIDDTIRLKIATHHSSQNDYMSTKKHVIEDPHDTIQYILRGRKAIKLPFMSSTLEARRGNLFTIWLAISWLLVPIVSVAVAMVLITLPTHVFLRSLWIFIILDTIYFANFVMEFFSLELVVVKKKCIKRILGLRRFARWTVYLDIVALFVPMLTYATHDWTYQLICFLRLRLLHDYHFYFCRSFKSKVAPIAMNCLIVLLMLHAMSCGWIFIACRDKEFPLKVSGKTDKYNQSIDTDVWVLPTERQGGCARITKNLDPTLEDDIPGFVVPKDWRDDYIVSMTFIILLHTQTAISTVVAVSLKQIYYKIIINFCTYVIDLWLMSVGISYIYTRYRELYQYDYNVWNLITFLKHSEISPALLDCVRIYTKQLWRRQRGTWLPELAHQAPMCLREDLLCALYMHHLETPPLFRQLPPYFIRQLAARLNRIVIFPGKCIVEEGDMFACVYFIHEGEVEKWYNDKSGESRMMSLLFTNGYFGLIPGLFPNAAFQFSYYTRTVVDLVFLRLRDWQDLLDCYPDVKTDLYKAARQLKKDFFVYSS